MPTASARKPATRAITAPMLQAIMASLNSVPPRQARRIAALPVQTLRELFEELCGLRPPIAARARLLKRLQAATDVFAAIREAVEDAPSDTTAAAAGRQAVEYLERLVADGTLLEPADIVSRLRWTRQALSKARKARRIFLVEVKGKDYYPAFFADPQYERRQLEAVSKVLGDLPGAAKLEFMMTAKASLDARTPLKALADGRLEEVKVAAKGFAQR